MTLTFIGQAATRAGHTQQHDLAGTPEPFTIPANNYLRHQRATIPVYFDHDETWPLGTIGHLERSHTDGLMVVGTIDADIADLLADGDWRLSAGVRTRRMDTHNIEQGMARLNEVSLVRNTATLNTRPVRWSYSRTEPRNMPVRWYDTWNRGVEHIDGYRRFCTDRLTIVDMDPLDAIDELLTDPDAAAAAGRKLRAERAADAAAVRKMRAERAAAPPDPISDLGPPHRRTFSAADVTLI